MKVTTLRFGQDLWNLLEREAELAGVSVSQYVREAALARASASAGARGDIPFDGLRGSAREVASGSMGRRHDIEMALAALARALAADKRDSATALRGESEQRSQRATQLKDAAAAERGE